MNVIKMPFWCNIVNDWYVEEKKPESVTVKEAYFQLLLYWELPPKYIYWM